MNQPALVLWRWFKNWISWKQCESEMPWGKRIILCCRRSKGHYGCHRNGNDIWL